MSSCQNVLFRLHGRNDHRSPTVKKIKSIIMHCIDTRPTSDNFAIFLNAIFKMSPSLQRAVHRYLVH